MKSIGKTFALLAITFAGLTTTRAQDPLPSWNDTAPKEGDRRFCRKSNKGRFVRLQFAYGEKNHESLDAAKKNGCWTVVSMKDDWKTIFPFAPK